VECNTILQNCTVYKEHKVTTSNNNGLGRTRGAGAVVGRNSLCVVTHPADAPPRGQVGNGWRQGSSGRPAPEAGNSEIVKSHNLRRRLICSENPLVCGGRAG